MDCHGHNFFKGVAPLGEMLAFFSQPLFWRYAGAYDVAFDRKCTFGAKNGAEASYNFLKGAAPLGETLAFFPQPSLLSTVDGRKKWSTGEPQTILRGWPP